ASGPDGYSYHITGDNVTLQGLIFNGGGLFIEKPGSSFNKNILIDNCEFHLNAKGQYPHGISFTVGLQNSKITNNLFTGNSGGGFGIYGYNYNNLTLANNEFVSTTAAAHIDAQGSAGQNNNKNLLAEQNYMIGMKGMGFEFQGNAIGVIVQDNWFEHPNLSTTPSQNTNSMAFSLILDKAQNIVAQRNTVIAPERPDGLGCRVGFEIGGDNSLVTDNYINGINITVADNDGEGTGSVIVKNNKFTNFLQHDYQSFPTPTRTYSSSNNGPDVQLTWDINRDKPQRNVRYGTTPPPTIPTTDQLPNGFTLTATPTDSQTINFNVSNVPQGAETITIACISTVGREVGAKVGPIFISKTFATISQSGYHPGWQITLFAIALDVNGKVLSESSTALKMPGDPTTPWPSPKT
ncbi:MAG TPA: right-handed parallel beta-helix repeat-containing protein, partial [Tepidisphaeraceae bacterium]|nr:right-handed parallel beta-helix repeat-containing protein [Tepidisphaeraceae bacterium]